MSDNPYCSRTAWSFGLLTSSLDYLEFWITGGWITGGWTTARITSLGYSL